jgi:serine/threonine protein kinase
MAEVHLSLDPLADGQHRLCVIKRISQAHRADKSFVEMFKEEQRLSRMLRHPNVVELYDAGEIDGTLYLSFELIDGITLADLRILEQQRTCPVRALIEIAIGVASALEYAHQLCGPDGQPLQLVHRDVSPQNILITRSGQVKLVDFGIARFDQRNHQTRVGFTKGKIRYMSPEHLSGRRLDGRSDLFPLAIVLLEVLSRRLIEMREVYYDEGDLKDLALKATREHAGMPIELEELLLEMLSFRPQDRPESAFAVRRRLEHALARVDGESLEGHVDALVFAELPPIRDAIERAISPGAEHETTAPNIPRGDENTLEDSWQEDLPTVRHAPLDPLGPRPVQVVAPRDWSDAAPTFPPEATLVPDLRRDTEAPRPPKQKGVPARSAVVVMFLLLATIAALLSVLIFLALNP